ncbi:MAG: tRNA (adenosine(37)-N6)-threonylcarbamoyltransferase complex ATPase subunit type 1 TsaE [Candidatus Omnitrophica bacterium]|nr:tRNA (adenosine(37)-N6)-threonylcarbamoyltransferase complex ATPase subunit type 1 TsaE [Candidatus Omnitrophota bacterium]
MKIISKSVSETSNIGKKIAGNLTAGDIICLFGELGSGKTVLAKGIASGLGINKNKIVSPSFVLIRQYNQAKLPLYHFDLYRLKALKDIAFLGYEEYLYGEGVAVIEWADRLGKIMPKEYLGIELLVRGKSRRLVRFKSCGRHYKELLDKVYEDTRH